nr:DNA primase [Sphingomonas jatrophae]
MLSPAFLDELRARTSLSGLIGRTVKLQKAGNEHKACCPFHQEKTPSFWVNDQKAFYHCFGCGAHGDAIRFLTEARGLAFMDAVKELADAAGLELPAPTPAARAQAEREASLGEVVEQAAAWFRQQLGGIDGAGARAYLDKRGIGAEARAAFGIGFAPDSRGKLKAALAEAGEDRLVEAGLVIEVEGKERYDRFRGRLMIPIRDAKGRAIAFGGRILGDGEPKYLNSPETPLFDKGRTLFNLDRAGPASRRSGRLLVVEGYLDVIALDQAGIREAVAPLGTALTEHQLERLWRLVDEPILCFDGDKAGRRAAVRAAQRALPLLRPGKALAFALLPEGQDPDDLVRSGGPEAMEALLDAPVPLATLLYEAERDQVDLTRPELRAGLRAKLDELAGTCADRLVAEEFRRTFRELFFEEFGWKKTELRAIAGAIHRTGGNPAEELPRRTVRALLLGLSRHPRTLTRRAEDIACIRIDDPDLRRWRQVLVDATFRHPNLDVDAVEAILGTAVMPELLRFADVSDLRYRFTARTCDADEAVSQLDALISLLCGEREMSDQLAELDRAAIADDGSEWDAIEAARGPLRAGLRDLHEQMAEQASGEAI